MIAALGPLGLLYSALQGGYPVNGALSLHSIGTIYEPTGYANANRQMIKELTKLQVSVRYTPIHPETVQIPIEADQAAFFNQLVHTALPPNHPVLIHYPAQYFFKPVQQYTIGMTMFECHRLPRSWARMCNMMNEVWVPSRFNQESFARSGVPLHKLKVMPYGVDCDVFRKRPTSLSIPNLRSFVFLCICSFDDRKGVERLVAAFATEFSEQEDVCLLIKSRASSIEEIHRQHAQIKATAERISGTPRPSIQLLSSVEAWSEEQLADLYNLADGYVLPTRGEGWSLTVMEAMACELPVITTNWSAHLDFLHEGNSFLIPIRGLVASSPSTPRICWADPDPIALRQLMRHVVSHPEDARMKAAWARQTVAEQYTWRQCAERIALRLRELSIH